MDFFLSFFNGMVKVSVGIVIVVIMLFVAISMLPGDTEPSQGLVNVYMLYGFFIVGAPLAIAFVFYITKNTKKSQTEQEVEQDNAQVSNKTMFLWFGISILLGFVLWLVMK